MNTDATAAPAGIDLPDDDLLVGVEREPNFDAPMKAQATDDVEYEGAEL